MGDMNIKILDRFYTLKEIHDNVDEDGYIEGVVKVELSDIIVRDYEQFLDLISILLVGDDMLMDISYYVTGYCEGKILIYVQGNAEEYLRQYEDGEDAE